MFTLRLFCDVAQHRSFSQAAAEHGVTQSAASQRIGALEKRLGVTLIDRSVRPLALTPAGEMFAREVLELLERYDDLEQRIRTFDPEPSGTIRVDAIYSAGIELLKQVKEQFEQRYQRVNVIIAYKHPEAVYNSVHGFECDLGVVSYPQRWRDVACIPLREEVMAVVCAPGHPLAGRERVNASELAQWPLVSFDHELPVGRHIRRYLREQQVNVEPGLQFDNVDTIKGVVAVTEQVAILPRCTARREVAAGTLVSVPLEPQLVRPMGIIHRRRQRHGGGLTPAAQALVEFLVQKAATFEQELAAESAAGAATPADSAAATSDGSGQLIGGPSR